MKNLILDLLGQLTQNQKKEFIFLQLLVVLMAALELVGIASIAPFMAVVSDPDIIKNNEILFLIYNFAELENEREFLFFLGGSVLIALVVSAMFSTFTTWKMALFSSKVGTEFSTRLYRHYLRQNWIFHSSGSSAQLTKQVSTESARVAQGIIEPLIQMNSKLVVASAIAGALVLYDPTVALLGIVVFGLAYYLLFKIVRNKLQKNGELISRVMTERFRLLNEGFGGIKEIIVFGRGKYFLDKFAAESNKYASARGANIAIALVPRYIIELVAFGSLMGLILYLLAHKASDISVILPLLSVYALAAFKLLPALQHVYSGFAQVKGNLGAYEAIKPDLHASRQKVFIAKDEAIEKQKLKLKNKIELKNIIFSYPGKQKVLNEINLMIQAKSIIGFAGPSGSGKSTIVDLILGLIEPQTGSFLIDDVCIDETNKAIWQKVIGFVPQDIFLSEGSIAENIAFGIPKNEINLDRVNDVLRLSHLEEFVSKLDGGINTKVGERGVQLSGGQRQRIGIARSLYNEAEVLIFDEATSSLDGTSEKMIMEAIHELAGKKTIIIVAHRLKTLENCDQIFFIDRGIVKDSGTYQDLIDRNIEFRRMSLHV